MKKIYQKKREREEYFDTRKLYVLEGAAVIAFLSFGALDSSAHVILSMIYAILYH